MKSTRSASATPDAHGSLAVRVLPDLTERQRFDGLLEAEHSLGPRFPAGDRLYQVAEQAGQWVPCRRYGSRFAQLGVRMVSE